MSVDTELEQAKNWQTVGTGNYVAHILLKHIPESKIPKTGTQYNYMCRTAEELSPNESWTEKKQENISLSGTIISTYSSENNEPEAYFNTTEEFESQILPESSNDTTTVYVARLSNVDYKSNTIIRLDTDIENKVIILNNNECGIKIFYNTPKLEIKKFERILQTKEKIEEENDAATWYANNDAEGRKLLSKEEENNNPNFLILSKHTDNIVGQLGINEFKLPLTDLKPITEEQFKTQGSCGIRRKLGQEKTDDETGILIAKDSNNEHNILARKIGDTNMTIYKITEEQQRTEIPIEVGKTNIKLFECTPAPNTNSRGGSGTIKYGRFNMANKQSHHKRTRKNRKLRTKTLAIPKTHKRLK
jgi:hypothetical protein